MQIKKHRVIPSAPTTYVCPTPSSNSFSVWSKRQFSDNLQCRVKPSKYGGGRFFKIICSVYFERFNRIDRTLDILASIPAPNSSEMYIATSLPKARVKTKSIWTTHTKTNQSIPPLKSHFRPAHENQVNFDPYIETK